jgi:hypothetical protein
MVNEYRLKRHTELWETQNKQIKRILIGGLFFAYLLLFNILTPFSHRLDDIKAVTQKLNSEVNKITDSKQSLSELKETLKGIQETIAKQPWMKEKDNLMERFAKMNAEGRGSWARYQKEADSTVSVIGSLVLQKVSKPLNKFLTNPSYDKLMPKLTIELNALPQVVEQWTNENHGNIWYRTPHDKEATVHELTSELEDQLEKISLAINQEQPNLKDEENKLKAKIVQLNEMKAEEEKKLPEKLDAEMKKILPNWISGIISVKQLMLYPFVIIVIVCYVSIVAFALTRHYCFMASSLNIENDESSDSALSSLWTLTYRGRIGTLLTLTTYIIFIISMWFFYEEGFRIFNTWLTTEPNRILNYDVLQTVHWMGRLILISSLIAIAVRPFYGRVQLTPERLTE